MRSIADEQLVHLGRLWYPQEHLFQTPAGTSGNFHRIQAGITTRKAVIEYTCTFWRVKHTEDVCLSAWMILGLPVLPVQPA